MSFFINQPWVDDAACRNRHPSTFFAERTGTPNDAKKNVAQAKAICDGCRVREQCREHGIENELFGVWGGLTESERADIRRTRRVGPVKRKPPSRTQGCGTAAGYRWHLRHDESACEDCLKANRLVNALRSKREAS